MTGKPCEERVPRIRQSYNFSEATLRLNSSWNFTVPGERIISAMYVVVVEYEE